MDGLPTLSAILVKIPGERPSGQDLRQDFSHDSLYGRLKDARNAARSAERRQEADGEDTGPPPEWKLIEKLAADALATRSKDLELAVWMTEALLRLHGPAGLADGFTLLLGLVETFWPDVHPAPDEEGIEATLAPLAGLNGSANNGTLLQPLRKIRLTQGLDGTAYALWQVEQAMALAELAEEKRRRRIEAGAVTMEAIEASAKATPGEFFVRLAADLDRCIDAFRSLNRALADRAGPQAPPSSAVDGLLQALRMHVDDFGGAFVRSASVPSARNDGPAGVPVASDGVAGNAVAGNGAAVSAAGTGSAAVAGFSSREEALRTLEAVGRYFRQVEPHSPIAYTLDELVRRSRMSFIELLAELLPDESARRGLLSNAGINSDLAEPRQE
jgi:type VI secretion system protein ImpA